MITGVHGTIVCFVVAALITDVLFKQFLFRTAVQHSRQRTVMALSDIIAVHGILWCGMRGFIGQSILLFAKNKDIKKLRCKIISFAYSVMQKTSGCITKIVQA